MSICHYCGGVFGRDCFNPQECGRITRQMEIDQQAHQEESDAHCRIEELQIEIERLKNWIGRIGHEAWKGSTLATIEAMAEESIRHSSCACHPEWGPNQDWAALGKWPPKHMGGK